MIGKTDVSSAGGTVTVRIKQRDADAGVELTFTEARELHEQLSHVLAKDNRLTRLRSQAAYRQATSQRHRQETKQ